MSIKHRKEKDCLNCGHLVEEKFCSHCGQENLVVKEDAWHMVTHAIADYFHFEHKFFATMRPLLFKPGQLTKEYVKGKRASFIHPIRLYIFVSIVFFLVILSKSDSEENTTNTNVKIKRDLVEKAKEDSIAKAELKKELDSIPMSGLGKKIMNKAIDKAEIQDGNKKGGIHFIEPGNFGDAPSAVKDVDTNYAAYLNRVSKLPKDQRPGLFRKYYVKNQLKFKGEDGQKKFRENLVHNIPKTMFILLPLFAAMLHLFYIRKKRYYYEDLIYSFHLHSSIFLAILMIKLLNWLVGFAYDISGITITVLTFYIMWYIYRSLRTFYGSSRWRTILKICFLFFGYTFLLAISFVVIATFTVIAQ